MLPQRESRHIEGGAEANCRPGGATVLPGDHLQSSARRALREDDCLGAIKVARSNGRHWPNAFWYHFTMRLTKAIALSSLVAALFGCQEPTQVRLNIWTDVPYDNGRTVTITATGRWCRTGS